VSKEQDEALREFGDKAPALAAIKGAADKPASAGGKKKKAAGKDGGKKKKKQ